MKKSSLVIQVPDSFRHFHGLKLALEKEYPGMDIDIEKSNVPKVTVHQLMLSLDGAAKVDPNLLTKIQESIDNFCKLYLPRLER